MGQGINRLTGCCTNGGCKIATEILLAYTRCRSLSTTLSSDRNPLSNALLTGLGPSFTPLASLFIPSLLGLCARTKKVVTRAAMGWIFAIVRSTRSPSLLLLIVESLNHKSASMRSVVAECVFAYLTCLNLPEIVNDTHARLVEDIIN